MSCSKVIKGLFLLLSILTSMFYLTACSVDDQAMTGSSRSLATGEISREEKTQFCGDFRSLVEPGVTWSENDLNEDFSLINAVLITFQGGSALIEGEGAVAEGEGLKIFAAGTYIISGELKDGRIHLAAGDDDQIRLILNGVDLTNGSGSPLYIENAGAVVITLAEGTVNTFTDGEEYLTGDKKDEPNAAIYSNSDLTINGSGTLTVFGKFKHGIVSKNDLKIINAKVKVNAADTGLKGNNLVAFRNANIAVKAGNDGIQAINDRDPALGLVYIDGGVIDVYAVMKGIQAAADLVVIDGEIIIESSLGC